MIAIDQIVNAIEQSGKALSIQQIMDLTGLSYSSVSRETKALVRNKDIARIRGGGNSWLYTVGEGSFKKKSDAVKKKDTVSPDSGVPLRELERFLKHMAKENWVHPIFKKQRELNVTLLDIFELAYDKATGSQVTDEDLAPHRSTLEILLGQLNQYSDLIKAMLKQGYLWDSDTFAEWLTENYTTSEIRDMVREARKHN